MWNSLYFGLCGDGWNPCIIIIFLSFYKRYFPQFFQLVFSHCINCFSLILNNNGNKMCSILYFVHCHCTRRNPSLVTPKSFPHRCTWQFGKIYFAIWTNKFCYLDKYILPIGQIYFGGCNCSTVTHSGHTAVFNLLTNRPQHLVIAKFGMIKKYPGLKTWKSKQWKWALR